MDNKMLDIFELENDNEIDKDYLKAPFPYFGGKSKVANIIWQALGDVKHYLEPFFGSGAVLLARPNYDYTRHIETINDKDGYVVNVWRALKYAPEEVAKYCDYPVIHIDMLARRRKLIEAREYLFENLLKDEEWYDAKLAGYWIYGMSCWIGGNFTTERYKGQNRIPYLACTGKGVHKLTIRSNSEVNENILSWFKTLSSRLRYVRIVNGDWTRVCGGNWQDIKGNIVGIFFDPPYSVDDRFVGVYLHDELEIAKQVEEWCLERGRRENYRIVCAGYTGEYEKLIKDGWKVINWKNNGGYANTSKKNTRGKVNKNREILVFSPYCLI